MIFLAVLKRTSERYFVIRWALGVPEMRCLELVFMHANSAIFCVQIWNRNAFFFFSTIYFGGQVNALSDKRNLISKSLFVFALAHCALWWLARYNSATKTCSQKQFAQSTTKKLPSECYARLGCRNTLVPTCCPMVTEFDLKNWIQRQTSFQRKCFIVCIWKQKVLL